MNSQSAPSWNFRQTCRRLGIIPTRYLLSVNVATQTMVLSERTRLNGALISYEPHRFFRVSTSRYGTGQISGSNRTPLGLHRIAKKIGGGWPSGAVFRSRRMVGYTWKRMANAAIAHR